MHYKMFVIFFLLLAPININSQPDLITAQELERYKFTNVITGTPKIAAPINVVRSSDDKITEEIYQITAVKTTQRFLPDGYPSTNIYAYSILTDEGVYASYPSAAIIAKKDIPVKIHWINNITGRHMLPLDFSHPFMNGSEFRNEVPICPHLHGACVHYKSDGLPLAYWTCLGNKGSGYQTEQPCRSNEAIYKYTNQQETGYLFFHDHTMGITRLNVYAGMVGLYQIIDNPYKQKSYAQTQLSKRYGNLQKKYFAISDRSFYRDGSLYYPTQSVNPDFTSWVPQFFGDIMIVNGKFKPKVNLDKKIYRMVFLNGCQSRYLNIRFYDTKGQTNIKFKIIKFEGDFLQKQSIQTSHLISPSERVEIIVDLSEVKGDLIMTNDANTPYPGGEEVKTEARQIMKIAIDRTIPSSSQIVLDIMKLRIKRIIDQKNPIQLQLKKNQTFPKFSNGIPVYEVLAQIMSNDQVAGALIGGTSLTTGETCQGAIFQVGKVYDIHIINLTADTHPLHFHLINFQKVRSYKFDVEAYQDAWHARNNGAPPLYGYSFVPVNLDPEPFRIGQDQFPKQHQKVFRDVIDANPEEVTVFRMKISHNNGQPFSFEVRGSRYVWHCHILEHQDNQMMKYICFR